MTDPLIQALLAGPAQSWNGGDGSPVLLTFAFAAAAPQPDGPGLPGGAWAGFSAAQQQAARTALAAWAEGAGLAFVEVPDQAGGAGIDLRFGLRQLDLWWANGQASLAPEGEIALNLRFYAGDPLQPGGSGHESLLHEIGHALGLKHSFEGDITLPAALDTRDTSLMAYARGSDGFATAPRALDHAAIQALYGSDPVPGQAGWDAAAGQVRITGTAAGEVLRGTALPDLILGGGGTDHLLGREGDDVLRPDGAQGLAEGGAGFDRLWIAEAHDRVALSLHPDTGRGMQGEVGTLAFTGIEAIRFLDGTLTFDAADPVAMASRLHLAATGQAAGAAALGALALAPDTAAAALALPGAAGLAALSDEGFLAQIYASLLHRAPDTPGLDYWNDRLEKGLGRAAALDSIARSAEAVAQQHLPEGGLWSADPAALTVRQLYRTTLDRAPDAAGLRWGLELAQQEGAATLADALLQSPEFTGHHGRLEETGLVDVLYQAALGRAPDAAGALWWQSQLEGGQLDAAHFALALAGSQEMQLRETGAWDPMATS
jgi:hypothetical protein